MARPLRVEHPHGVGLDLSRSSSARSPRRSCEPVAQHLDVAGAVGGGAHGVEQQVERCAGRATRGTPSRGRSPRRRRRDRPSRATSMPTWWCWRNRPACDVLVAEAGVAYQTFHGVAGGARRTPGRPTPCPRAAARCGGRPCRRSRTSPCGRRRCPRRLALEHPDVLEHRRLHQPVAGPLDLRANAAAGPPTAPTPAGGRPGSPSGPGSGRWPRRPRLPATPSTP